MRRRLGSATFFLAWLCLWCATSPRVTAAEDYAAIAAASPISDREEDGNGELEGDPRLERADSPAAVPPVEAIERWLDQPIEPSNNEPRGIERHEEILQQCRVLFQEVGRSCEEATFESLSSAALILARTVNKLIENNSVGAAALVLPLFLALESCSGRDVDASPLLNFAALPKLYQPKVRRLSEDEAEDSMRVLRDVFRERAGAEKELLRSVVARKHLEGPKWDAFVELAGYNLALLQYHDGHVTGARRTHEALIREDRPRTWNRGLREQASAVRSQVEAALRSAEDGDAIRSTKSLVILTCASDPKRPELEALIRSAERVVMEDGSSPEVRVLGSDRPFPGTYVKVELLLAETAGMHPDQLVLFLDAYDTLLFPSVRELPDLYRRGALTSPRDGDGGGGGGGSFRSVVFGAERGRVPYPDPGIGPLFDDHHDDGDGNAPFRYLNSGTILGTASALADMASEVASYPSVLGSDQRGYSRYYLTHRNTTAVGMDVVGRAFLTLYALPESTRIDLITGQLRNDVHAPIEEEAEGGTEGAAVRPAVIHGNGGKRSGKEYYRRIAAVADQAASFPWTKHLGSSAQSPQWVTIRPPPFTYAGLAEDGSIELGVALDVFRGYVRGGEGGTGDEYFGGGAGSEDVEALMYLVTKLVPRGELEEAQTHLNAAVRADRELATELYERARDGGGSLF